MAIVLNPSKAHNPLSNERSGSKYELMDYMLKQTSIETKKQHSRSLMTLTCYENAAYLMVETS